MPAQRPRDLNLESSEDDIIIFAQEVGNRSELSSERMDLYLSYAMDLLTLKQRKKATEDQQLAMEMQDKMSKKLTRATWVLAAATIVLALSTIALTYVTYLRP